MDALSGIGLFIGMRHNRADIETFAHVAGPLLVYEIERANDMPHVATEHPLGLE